MKKTSYIKSNFGFTLIELIVTLSIMAILMAVAGGFYLSSKNRFVHTEKQNIEKFLGDSVYQFMQEELIYATKLEIINLNANPMPDPSYDKVIEIGTDEDIGCLMSGKKNNVTNHVGKNYYGQYIVSYTVKVFDKSRLELTVNVKDKTTDEIRYTAGSVIKNLNLELNKSEIEIPDGLINTAYIDPVVSYNEDVEDNYIDAPTELRTRLLRAYADMLKYAETKDQDKKPVDWNEIVKPFYNNTNNFTNDTLRFYVAQFYYKEKPYDDGGDMKKLTVANFPDPPKFSSNIVDKIDKKIALGKKFSDYLKTDNLKTQVYINLDVSGAIGDGSCYVYVSAVTGWNGCSLFYNHNNGCWYYNPSGITFANRPWETFERNGVQSNLGVWNEIESNCLFDDGRKTGTGKWVEIKPNQVKEDK